MTASQTSTTVDEIGALDPLELMNRRHELIKELGKYELEIERRRTDGRIHVPGQEPDWWEDPNTGVKMWTIIAPTHGFGIRNFMVAMLEVPPRTTGGRYHVHGDAVKYYLSGRGTELVGDESFEVQAGDFVYIPANVWHGTENPYDEPVRMLATQQWPGTHLQVPAPSATR